MIFADNPMQYFYLSKKKGFEIGCLYFEWKPNILDVADMDDHILEHMNQSNVDFSGVERNNINNILTKQNISNKIREAIKNKFNQ